MSDLSLNGIASGANIFQLQLKEGQTAHQAWKQGQDDGLDQVYFKAGDAYYLAEGDGLDLSGLEAIFPNAALEKADGTSIPAEILAVDDEVNTAWEGVKHVGKASLGLLSAGLLGGGVMAGKGMVQVAPSVGLLSEGVTTLKAGYKLFEAGMIPVQQGMSQSITAVEKLVGTGSAATTTVAKPSSSIFGRIFDKVGNAAKKGVDTANKVVGLPQTSKEIVAGLGKINTGSASVQKGLEMTGQSLKSFDQSVNVVKSSTSTFKTGAYIVGIGAAVAGTVVLGGAIYGAARGEETETLSQFRGQVID